MYTYNFTPSWKPIESHSKGDLEKEVHKDRGKRKEDDSNKIVQSGKQTNKW